MTNLTVIIPTHNPSAPRFARTLAGLRAQTIPAHDWETVLIDNASAPAIDAGLFRETAPANLRFFREPKLGLSAARRRGFTEAKAPLCVLVDDDNVLAPDYLEIVMRVFAQHSELGAIGGRSIPEFEQPPTEAERPFLNLLALRDLGDTPLFSRGLRPSGAVRNEYPACAPIGAGMALRTEPARRWAADGNAAIADRQGRELTSGGDNDIVLTLLSLGWEVAYIPELALTHLIPVGRLDVAYLARLNRGIQKSWMRVLTKHDANPWPAIAPWTVPLRQAKAWFTHRGWAGPSAHIRWQGACGHFEGRVP